MLRERIKTIRQHQKLSQRAMADMLGISLKSWQDYEAGKSVPGGKVFESICRLGFSGTWLLTGEGSMRHQQLTTIELTPAIQDPVDEPDYLQEESPENASFYPIQLIKSFLNDGAFISTWEKSPFAFRKGWLIKITQTPEKMFLLRVPSTSMEPTIMSEEMVLLDTGRTRVFEGAIYALAHGDAIVMRRLKLLHNGKIHVTWDNMQDDDKPYDVDPSKLKILGQVVWMGRGLVNPLT